MSMRSEGHPRTASIIMALIILLGPSLTSQINSKPTELGEEQVKIETSHNHNFFGFTEGSAYTATTIAASISSTCAILVNNSLYCWGSQEFGQLGTGNWDSQNQPTHTQINGQPEEISSYGHHSCLTKSSGVIMCWGTDSSGELGNDDNETATTNSPVSTSMPLSRTSLQTSSGLHHTCSLMSDNSIWCWGDNSEGQLGIGSEVGETHLPTNTTLPFGRTAISVSSGSNFNCAILDDGSGVCWGDNSEGQIGDGTNEDRNVPTQISSLPLNRTLVAIGTGSGTACAILDDGSVMCWGDNSDGEFGDGSTTSSNEPTLTSLPPGRTAISIDVGSDHTCAILDNQKLFCWGLNDFGQIGDGTNSDRLSPIEVDFPSETNVSAVSTGAWHTCAITTTSQTYCWGKNSDGQIGDGSSGDENHRIDPTAISFGSSISAKLDDRDPDEDGEISIFDDYPLLPCSPGEYFTNNSCLTTDPGHYTPGPGLTSQTECENGTFQPLPGMTFCNPSTPGHFVNLTGSTNQSECLPGTFQPNFEQISCFPAQPGNFSEAGSSSQIPCSPGTFQPLPGSSECIGAEPGHFVNSTGSTEQSPCDPGTYQPTEGQQECMPVEPGNFANTTGSTEQSPCDPGTYQPTEGQQECLPVEAGHFTPDTASSMQTPCEEGTFQPDTGSSSCIEAEPGFHVNSTAATSQDECAAGTFSSEVGQSNCTQADPGNFVGLDGATSQTPCPPGSYQGAAGSDDCQQTPPGQIASKDGSNTTMPCPVGKYQPNAGSTSCREASPGHFVNESGATEQTPCTPGSFQSEPGQSGCTPASPGNHVPTQGSTGQMPCQPGSYQPSEGESECDQAMPGHHVPEEGAVSQSTCNVGTFQPGEGQGECMDSSPGNFVNSTGSPSQTPCQPGSYQDEGRTIDCKQADPGHFVPNSGAIEQTKCPSGETQELSGQIDCERPKTPLWLIFVMVAAPSLVLGTMAIVYLMNRQKKERLANRKSYMYAEDVRFKFGKRQ